MNEEFTQPEIQPAKAEKDHGLEDLKDFIRKNGGTVTFAQFMKESLYGQDGFYDTKVRIGKSFPAEETGHFKTFASSSELFSYLLAKYAQKNKARNILELAGGQGELKQRLLGYLSKVGDIDTKFLSLEISPMLADKQQEHGPTIRAQAHELPLATDSFEGLIIANELFDNMTGHVIYVGANAEESQFNEFSTNSRWEELCFTLTGEEITAEWRTLSEDASILARLYLEYLENYQIHKTILDNSVFTLSLDQLYLLKELARVMKNGSKAVFFDYQAPNGSKFVPESPDVPRFYGEGADLLPEEAWKIFKESDITYNVNIQFLVYIANRLGFKCTVLSQAEFFKNLTSEQENDPIFAEAQAYDDKIEMNPINASAAIWGCLILEKSDLGI